MFSSARSGKARASIITLFFVLFFRSRTFMIFVAQGDEITLMCELSAAEEIGAM